MADVRQEIEIGIGMDTRDLSDGVGRAVREGTRVDQVFAGMATAAGLARGAMGALSGAFGLAKGAFETLIRPAAETRGELERLDRAVTSAVGALGELLEQTLSSALQVSGLTEGIEDIGAALRDSQSEIGSFIRGGIAFLVEGFTQVLIGSARVAQGLSLVADGIREVAALAPVIGRESRGVLNDWLAGDPELRASLEATRDGLAALANPTLEQTAMLGQLNLALMDVADEGLYQDIAALEEVQRHSGETAAAIEEMIQSAREQSDAIQEMIRNLDLAAPATEEVGEAASSAAEDIEDLRVTVSQLSATMAGAFQDALPLERLGRIRDAFVRIWEDVQPEEQGPAGFGLFQGLIDQSLAAAAVMPDTWQTSLEAMAGVLTSGLAGMSQSIGAWIVDGTAQFANFGEAVKSIFAGFSDSIAAAFTQAATGALISGSGPFGALLGIGLAFSLISGLLSGGTSGSTAAARPEVVDVPLATGPLASSTGGATSVTQLAIGAVFTRDGTRRELEKIHRESRRLGE